MKNKTISLPDDIFNKLHEEENASALISQLLKEHYSLKNFRQMSREELDLEIKKAQAKEDYETKMKEISQCQQQQN